MEVTTATTDADAAAKGNGAAPAGETIEVRKPADGSLLATVAVDSPEKVREVVARVRAAQPAWEAIGFSGRRHWLGKLRDWLIDNHDELADLMQAETGKVRADAELEAPFIAGVINFYGENAERFLADETPSAYMPMMRVKKLRTVLRPFPGRRQHQPLELPPDPRLRRLDPGADGRRRGGDQALRVHAADHDGDRPRLEGGDRRPRRPRLRQRHRRDRRGAGRRGRLHPVHRLRPHRQDRDEARRRHAHAGQPRARRQGPDDRPARRQRRARRQRAPPTAAWSTPARSACRSSASTSRSRSTTSSSPS